MYVLSPTPQTYLRNISNGAEVFVVGTAHVSKRSAAEVSDVIRAVRPETVVVELCEARARKLMNDAPPADAAATVAEVLRTLGAPGDLTTKLIGLGLRGFYAMWRHAGLEPGGEFKAALTEARAVGANVVYGDQDASETMRKLAQTITLPHLLRMLTSPAVPPPPELARVVGADVSVEEAIERLKNRATVRAMAAYTRQLHPQATRVLLDERDVILADSLYRQRGRVVGVVGLAHVDGIEQRWQQLNSSSSLAGSIAAK